MPSLSDYLGDDYAQPIGDTQPPEPVARTPEELAEVPSLSDHASYLANVYHNSLAGLHTALGSISDDPTITKQHDQLADQERSKASDAFDDMSLAGREASQNWNKHWMHGALFGAEQMLPGTAAGIAGGLIAGPAGAMAGFGGISASDFAGSTSAAVKQMTPEQLDKLSNSKYSTLTQNGMTDEDARNQIINDSIGPGMLIAGAAGAATAEVPGMGGTLAKRLAIGAATGGAGSAITDLALGVTTGQTPSAGDLTSSALSGAVPGMVFGAIGKQHGQRGPDRGKPVDSTTGTGIGSDRTGRAPEKQLKTPGKGDVTPEGNTATPPAPDILNTEQREALDVTLGSKQETNNEAPSSQSTAPASSTIQPPVAQPTPTPSKIASEAPRTADTTGPLPPYQEPPKGPPTSLPVDPERPPSVPPPTPLTAQPGSEPTPAPPVRTPSVPVSPQPTAAIPENPKTLQIQEQALAQGKKEVVFYPQGEGYSQSGTKALRDQPNVSVIKWHNKDVAVFRTDGPNNLTSSSLRSAVKEGKLNELLGLGDTTREEASARAATGETPAAVVERTPEGTEARAAAGTTETAPAQTATMEATKLAPENKISIERPVDVIKERLAARAPRILQDISKPREPAAPVFKATQEEVTPGVKHRTIAEKAQIARSNFTANRIVLLNKPMQREDLSDIYKRAGRMVEQAKARDITIPKELGAHHSAGMAILSEARTLISNKEPSPDAYARFLDREALFRAGKKDEALGIRKAEGAAELGGTETPDIPVETTPESELIAKQENEPPKKFEVVKLKRRTPDKLKALQEQLDARAEKPSPTAAMLEAGNYDKGHIRLEGENISVETGKGEVREPYDVKVKAHYGYIRGTVGKDGDHIDTYIGPKGETGKIFVMNQLTPGVGSFDEHKVFMGFDSKRAALDAYEKSFDDKSAWKREGGIVELNKNQFKDWLENGDHSQPINEGLEGEHPGQKFETMDLAGKAQTREYNHRSNVNEMLGMLDLGRWSPSLRPLIRNLADKFKSLIGDMPVYLLSNDEMKKLNPASDRTFAGAYVTTHNHIYLNDDILNDPRYNASHTIMHEILHAVTIHALNNDKGLSDLALRLYAEVKNELGDSIPQGLGYGLTNSKELMTELLTNPKLQDWLKHIPISPELAKDLGMPRWRKATMFQGALDWFRKLLGYGPRDYSYIEAALSIGEKAMFAKDPTSEYSYRLRASQVSNNELGEGPVHAMLSPEAAGEKFKQAGKDIQEGLKGFGTGREAPAMRATRIYLQQKLMAPDEWMRRIESAFSLPENNSFRRYINSMSSKDAEVKKELKLSDGVMKHYTQLSNDDPEEFQKLEDVLLSSSQHGVHPDDPLGVGRNKHIKVNKTNPENSNQEYKDAIHNHADDALKYSALTPESKELFGDVRDEMSREHKVALDEGRKAITNSIEKELRTGDYQADYKTAVQKVIDKEELDHDEQKLVEGDKNVAQIRNYDRTSRQALKGPYFPTRQEGTHVVEGEHDYKIPDGASRDPDNPNKIIFKTRKEAWDFTPKTKDGDALATDMSKKYYWPQQDGSKKYTSSEDVRATPDWRGKTTPEEEYHVDVNNKHYEFADSVREGEKYRKAMQDAGVTNVSQVLPRKENVTYGPNALNVKSMLDHVDKMAQLSGSEKEASKDAIRYAAIAGQRGNSINKNYLRRYGAQSNLDSVRTLDMRRRANASFVAMARHRPDIDEALEHMQKFADDNKQHDDAGELQAGVNIFKNRADNYQNDTMNNMKTSKFWNSVSTFATLKYLLSPAFLLRHQIHVPLFVLPKLAQHIGWWPALRQTMRIYKDMAGGWPVITRGVKSGLKTIWDYDKDPTDFIDALKQERMKRGGSAEEMKMIDQLSQWDLLHHTGIDFENAYRSQGALGKFQRGARNMAQEIIGSADGVSRFNSSLMFYRAARDTLGMDHDKATQFTADRIRETQGQFSSFNRLEVMRNPAVRAAMQFKSFPLLVLKTITKAMYNSLRYGASAEERWQGVKTLGGITAASMAISGVSGAMPEPIEDLIDVTGLLGLTDNWPQLEDKLRTSAAEQMSPEGANILMNGLGGALGIDLHHVGGISDMTGLPYILSSRKPTDDMYKWLAGVPGSIMGDGFTGMGDLQGGNIENALQIMLPKLITDPIKAYQEYTTGVTTQAGKTISAPVSAPEALLRALGFVTTTESSARQARYITGVEQGARQDASKQITQMWQSGDKVGAIQAMRAYNAQHPDQPIRPPSTKPARPTVLGYPETPRNQAELEARARAYGLQ